MAAKQVQRKTLVKPHVVWLKPVSYQPNKTELEEDMRVDATPEELANAVLRPVVVKRIG